MSSDAGDSATTPRLHPPGPHASTAGNEFSRLVEIMRLLRSPGGCPWDHEQTLASLAPYVLEEAHEVVDAIERGDITGLRGEIGDLIFEGVFLAQVASDQGHFDVSAALREVSEKLVRRHPHVFVGAEAPAAVPISTPGEVVTQWDTIKAREREEAGKAKSDDLDALPSSLPALTAAEKIGRRAARAGFDWSQPADVIDKIEEEIGELRRAIPAEGNERVAEELGDLLFAVSNLARKLGVDAESALRGANRKFISRFQAMRRRVEGSGRSMEQLTLDELEQEWQAVKGDVA